MGLIQPSTAALKAVGMSADDDTYGGWQSGWMVAVGLVEGIMRSLQLDSDLQLIETPPIIYCQIKVVLSAFHLSCGSPTEVTREMLVLAGNPGYICMYLVHRVVCM